MKLLKYYYLNTECNVPILLLGNSPYIIERKINTQIPITN